MKTSFKPQPQKLQVRHIRRKHVQQSLAIAAVLALLISGCGSDYNRTYTPVSPSPTSVVTEQNANEKIKAVFYENTAQCESDAKKLQDEYSVLLKAHQEGTLEKKPTAPAIKAEDCGPQMLAAQQEHDRNAPVYSTLADCEADGVKCEATPSGYDTSGYRPSYGGTYFYPYGYNDYVYVNYGGSRRRVYQPRTVYQSKTSGQVVTPHGRTVAKTQPGQVTVPRHTTVVAPPRPTGTTGRGTITGRSSKGFGSTFKSTGRGGK